MVIAAVRTPIGRYAGALKSVRPDDLAALVIREVVARSGIDPAIIDDVYLGAANQAGEDNRNVARMAALLAGLPQTVPGATVNRLCASGLEAVNIAARMIESGCADAVVAGGVESMTRAPFVMAKHEDAFDRKAEMFDTTMGWRFTNPRLAEKYYPYSMGETAENVARLHNVTREDQDRFAVASQINCARAMGSGRFADEIVPVPLPHKKGAAAQAPAVMHCDEHPRPDTTLEALARLKPAFVGPGEGGSVTAGNSSGINDGAAALLLVEAGTAKHLGLTPLARVGPCATAGVDPGCMGLGPVPAVQKLLHRAGLTLRDIDVIELNEAFAAQALACIRLLGMDDACWRVAPGDPGSPGKGSMPVSSGSPRPRLNPKGGAIALGHPLGMSGARLVVTIVHQMRSDASIRRALATLCVGVGQGVATLIERA